VVGTDWGLSQVEFTITPQMLITIGSAAGVIIGFFKIYNKAFKMFDHQKEQDAKIAAIDKGQTAILEALLGVLNGQIEQGLNGTTHEARDKLQAYLIERGARHD